MALSVYLKLIEPDAKAAELALDAAETMLDNGHLAEAKTLLHHGMRPGAPPKPTPALDQPPRERLARPSFLNDRDTPARKSSIVKLRETVSDTFFLPATDDPGSRFGLLALRKITILADLFP